MQTILLADDEKLLRILVHTTLDSPEFRILEANDGVEALEIARRTHPDLVLLDWMMPSLTGLEVAKRLKQDPNTADIPIIMLTAKGQESDRELAAKAGITAYLVKPFSPLALLERVRAALAVAGRKR
jgi:two-component system, OmpR family, phosphate regulon response regulator PhoB